MHQRRRCAGPRRNQERKEVKPEEYTIYERVPALSPGSFDERHMRRNLRITKLYGPAARGAGPAEHRLVRDDHRRTVTRQFFFLRDRFQTRQ